MASSIQNRKPSEIFKAQALLYKHIYNSIDSMCVKWCVEMNIPNIIHNHGQPISLSNLVSILQVPSTKIDNVQRLMRYLAHLGFFEIVTNQEVDNEQEEEEEEEEEVYSITVASELLIKGTELCLAPMVDFYLNPTISGCYHQLNKWIYEEHLTLFGLALGSNDFWKFLNTNPEYSRLFNDAMASDSKMMNLALKDCNFVFEGLESIVDIGGGTGTTSKIISETFPKLKCIVFDRPEVVANLPESNNLTYVSGDMFTSVPRADAVMLKMILHDWSDEDCIKILKKCKEAVISDEKIGKVVVIDLVMNDKKNENQNTLKLQMDVGMACLNGKERNEKEWKKLIVKAGFKDYKISPLTELLSLIEIYP